MEERLVDTMGLENGLTVEFYEASRPVAGDRWLVSMVACIEVALRPEFFQGQGQGTTDAKLGDIRKTLGEKVLYRHEKIRHFVAEDQKDDVFKALRQRFLDASLPYLSSPLFPYKLIQRKYQEAIRQPLAWKDQ